MNNTDVTSYLGLHFSEVTEYSNNKVANQQHWVGLGAGDFPPSYDIWYAEDS